MSAAENNAENKGLTKSSPSIEVPPADQVHSSPQVAGHASKTQDHARRPWVPSCASSPGWTDFARCTPPAKDRNDHIVKGAAKRQLAMSFNPDLPFTNDVPYTSLLLRTPWRLSLTGLSSKARRVLAKHSPKLVARPLLASGIQTFTLRNLGITSLKGFGVDPEVKKIYLGQNFLTSFKGWECQPALVELYAEDNLIESMRGACEQGTLEDLRLRGNPIAALPHYRTMCLLAFGKNSMHSGIRTIDGEAVKRSELELAVSLGKVGAPTPRPRLPTPVGFYVHVCLSSPALLPLPSWSLCPTPIPLPRSETGGENGGAGNTAMT